MKWLRQLFCKHEYEWRRNFYGDAIAFFGGSRSLWVCLKCDKWQSRPTLHVDKEVV